MCIAKSVPRISDGAKGITAFREISAHSAAPMQEKVRPDVNTSSECRCRAMRVKSLISPIPILPRSNQWSTSAEMRDMPAKRWADLSLPIAYLARSISIKTQRTTRDVFGTRWWRRSSKEIQGATRSSGKAKCTHAH